MPRNDEQRARDRAKAQAKRRANQKKGLTADGKPRKGTHKVNRKQRDFNYGLNRTPKSPKPPPKNETEEQRRARGYSIRGTPLARRLDESIAKRIKEME